MEELALIFPSSNITRWAHGFSSREFVCQFRSVRVLWSGVNVFMRAPGVGLYLQQDDGILPVLEEIELLISPLTRYSDEEHRRRTAEALAAFEPFDSARERADRIVKVDHFEQVQFK